MKGKADMMQYVSIDIETTGLDPVKNDIIEFAAVIDEVGSKVSIDELPSFRRYITKTEPYVGEAKALSMHQRIFERIAAGDPECIGIEDLMFAFGNFLQSNAIVPNSKGKTVINVAGKNFGSFDMQFLLAKIPDNCWNGISFRRRFIDPSILYMRSGDKCLPDLETCVDRMCEDTGLRQEWSHHTALDDAMQVVRLFRHKLRSS